MSSKPIHEMPPEDLAALGFASVDNADLSAQDAFHEASHAVIALLLGLSFQNVSIEREQTADGYTAKGMDIEGDYGPLPHSPQRSRLKQLAPLMVCFAGQIGQYLTGQKAIANMSAQDEKQAATMAQVIFPDVRERQQAIRDARKWTYVLLMEHEKNKAAVRALATVLLERQTVTHEEACGIIRRARRATRT